APYVEDHREEICLRNERVRDDKVARACGYMPSGLVFSVPTQRSYACLHTLSGYAYGRSSMMAAEIPAFAAQAGYKAALIADPFSLTGAREFWKTAEAMELKPLIGASFEMAAGGSLVLVAK